MTTEVGKLVSSGLYPGIKEACTISKRLDEEIMTGKEKDQCKIMTSIENEPFLRYISKQKQEVLDRCSFPRSFMNFV